MSLGERNDASMLAAFVRTTRREYLPIADRQAIEARVRDHQIDVDFMMARLVASSGADEAWAVEDRLDWLLQELCLHAARALLSDQGYSFRNWEYKGTISLSIEGDGVVLRDGQSKEARFPRRELLRGMLDCAAGMLQVVKDLHAIRPIGNFSIMPGLEGVLAECERLYAAKYH